MPGIEAAPTTAAALYVGLGHPTFWGTPKVPGYNSAWLVFAASAGGGVLSAIRSAISEKGQQRVSILKKEIERLFRLIGQVRNIVTVKSVNIQKTIRNLDALKKIQNPVDVGFVFQALVQPEEQVKDIVNALHDYFSAGTDPSVELVRVSIMKWSDERNHLVFTAHFPYDRRPRSPEINFSDGNTIAGRAYFNKELVICESIRTDPRYKRLQEPDEDGSLLSYPVYDSETQKVALVINVSSAKPRRFKDTPEERRVLTIPLQIFAERLLLENRLLEVKAKVA